MKQKMNKIAVLFVVSIFALTGVAAGYAMWFQDLTIDGKVETGELEWEFWEISSVIDPFCPPPYFPTDFPDWNCDPDLGFYDASGNLVQPWKSDKNVGCGEIEFVDKYTMKLTFNNVYPGYVNGGSIHLHCLGSIPIKLLGMIVSLNEDLSDPIAEIYKYEDGFLGINLNPDEDDDADCQLWFLEEIFGAQIEYCNTLEISFFIGFLQTLKQEQTYTIYLGIRGVQWNEYNPPT
jgi:hypothetical protein